MTLNWAFDNYLVLLMKVSIKFKEQKVLKDAKAQLKEVSR